jgi:hypothetical protein
MTSSATLPTASTIQPAPSTTCKDGKECEFTTQAALQIPRIFHQYYPVGLD